MKKRALCLILTLAVILSLCVPILAAGSEDSSAPSATNIAEGAEVAFQSDSAEKLTAAYTSSEIQKGGYYLLLVVKADSDDSYTISESSILYIDQVTAAEAGYVEFPNVYPSSIQNSVVLISGTGLSGLVKLAEISVPYTLGDVDLDGTITAADAVKLNQHLAGVSVLSGNAFLAADIDGDHTVTSADAVVLNKYLAGVIGELN